MIAAAACLLCVLPADAGWTVLRKDGSATLSIDPASVQRRGDDVRFRYLADYAKPQRTSGDAPYRSMVVDAAVRCKLRQIATGRARMYAGPGGRGRLVETSPIGAAPFEPVENATSDEDLWKRFCAPGK
jgi:hypothetical protein